jgi:hypothetical protein
MTLELRYAKEKKETKTSPLFPGKKKNALWYPNDVKKCFYLLRPTPLHWNVGKKKERKGGKKKREEISE